MVLLLLIFTSLSFGMNDHRTQEKHKDLKLFRRSYRSDFLLELMKKRETQQVPVGRNKSRYYNTYTSTLYGIFYVCINGDCADIHQNYLRAHAKKCKKGVPVKKTITSPQLATARCIFGCENAQKIEKEVLEKHYREEHARLYSTAQIMATIGRSTQQTIAHLKRPEQAPAALDVSPVPILSLQKMSIQTLLN